MDDVVGAEEAEGVDDAVDCVDAVTGREGADVSSAGKTSVVMVVSEGVAVVSGSWEAADDASNPGMAQPDNKTRQAAANAAAFMNNLDIMGAPSFMR